MRAGRQLPERMILLGQDSGSLRSVADLIAKMLAFIDYCNRTMTKPFQWTYRGKALAA
jgi:ribosomal protein S15P/S13E